MRDKGRKRRKKNGRSIDPAPIPVTHTNAWSRFRLFGEGTALREDRGRETPAEPWDQHPAFPAVSDHIDYANPLLVRMRRYHAALCISAATQSETRDATKGQTSIALVRHATFSPSFFFLGLCFGCLAGRAISIWRHWRDTTLPSPSSSSPAARSCTSLAGTASCGEPTGRAISKRNAINTTPPFSILSRNSTARVHTHPASNRSPTRREPRRALSAPDCILRGRRS